MSDPLLITIYVKEEQYKQSREEKNKNKQNDPKQKNQGHI